MAIQNRRGNYADFDPQKMVAGEWAVVQSGDPNSTRGKAVYMAFNVGDIERMATYEDMQENIVSATSDVQAQFASKLTQTINDANSAVDDMQTSIDNEIQSASDTVATLTTNTNTAINSANTAAATANTAADRANDAVEAIQAIIDTDSVVLSWNGRTGQVTPQVGDYTSAQITHGSGTVSSALTFDSAPTAGSQRAVQSGGVYSVLGNETMGTTATTITGAVQELNDKIGSTSMGTTATTLTGAIAELQSSVMQFHVFRFADISAQTDATTIETALQTIIDKDLGDITFVCYVFRTGAWQLNGFGSIRNGDARATFINGHNGQILVVNKTATAAINVIKTYS